MLSKKKIQLLNDIFEKLKQEFGLDELDEEIDFDTETIYVPFPKEEEIEFETDELLLYFNGFESFKIHDDNKVTTNTITQRVVSGGELSIPFYMGYFYMKTASGIELSIISNPLLIGIAATKMDEFSKYHLPCSSHIAVEVRYPNLESRLKDSEEEKLIKSFFFELAHSYKVSFTFSTFRQPEEFDEEELANEQNNLPKVLEDYNAGMELFIMANQSISPDLRFLTYYKVFEYFAPIYSRIESFEAMRMKLDSSNANTLSSNFIGSIFELTKNYENSLRDKELVKSIINKTFDFIDIYEHLPEQIKKVLKIEKLEYGIKKETLDHLINHLGNVLYNTRNSIVHAKSNYTPTGLECKSEDLECLNEFMHKACYSTIKWHNRLPKHLKFE